MSTSTRTAFTGDRIVPVTEDWERAMRTYGITTDVALAHELKVSIPTVWRVLRDQGQRPGEDFIKKALTRFWSADEERHFGFYDLFDGPWGR